jgi:hypothetical protein
LLQLLTAAFGTSRAFAALQQLQPQLKQDRTVAGSRRAKVQDPVAYELMRALNPKGILNPGKVL